MGRGSAATGQSVWSAAVALALALVTAASLAGCGKTGRADAPHGDEDQAGGAPQGGPASPSFPASPFGGSSSSLGGSSSSLGGSASSLGGSASSLGGESAVAGAPPDSALIGSPLGPEEATLHPAGCPSALENECETEVGEGRARLVTLPSPPSAFDATPEQQVFAACRTVYVQPSGGCVRPLGVTQGTIRRLAIVGDAYAVVQAESIRVVDAEGIVRAAWQSPRGTIWSSRVPPVVVSGSVLDFFVDDDLFELDPRTGETRQLARDLAEDVGQLVALGNDLVWTVGIREGGCIPHFTATGVQRFVRESGEIVRESDLACESLGTDGTHLYCAIGHHFERWRPGERPEADPAEDGGELLFGPGLIARGRSLYLPEDPATAVLTLAAPAFLLAGGRAYYQLAGSTESGPSVYRATLP